MTTTAEKLKIQPGNTLLTLNAPSNFKQGLTGLPDDVKVTSIGTEYDQVHWFVMNQAQLKKELSKVMKLVRQNILVWVYYPKGSSKIQTDLTRDKGWDCLLEESNKLTWISLIAFDETWSAFGFRAKTETDRKKEVKPKPPREIFKWIDAENKKVNLPEDVSAAFKGHKKEAGLYDELSFTNKKEYLEWIVTAKRKETRTERIKETIEKLGKGWKNPRNI